MDRTVEQWIEIFERTPSPNLVEYDMAQRILSDLWGYRHGSKYRDKDAHCLANAMVAYARMLQEHGVKV